MTVSMPTSAATFSAAAAVVAGEQDRASGPSAGARRSPRLEVGLTVSATTMIAARPAVPADHDGGPPAARRRHAACDGRRARCGDRSSQPGGRPRRPSRARRRRPCDADPAGGAKSRRPAAGRAARRRVGDRPRDRVLRRVLERAGERAAPRRGRRRGATTTDTTAIWPVVTVPVLSSTIVSTARVDSSTSGPRIRMPSWAPRPVPTSRAVGVARPRAHGQAMMRTATAAVNAAGAPAPVPSQKPSVATASTSTTGTKTPEIRSASRCTGALPLCASSTSRAICASWVSAPTRVARTTSRPPALTVAPTTGVAGADLDRHGLAGEQARASTAEVPRLDDAVGGDLLAGPDHEAVADGELTRSAIRRLDAVARARRRPWRRGSSRPRRAAPARRLARCLEPAAGQQERGHAGGGLEVDVARAVAAPMVSSKGCVMPGIAGVAEEQGVERPAEGGERADADQRVHGRGAVAQVRPGRAVERPAAPHHDRRGQGQREPLPERRTAAPGPSPSATTGTLSTAETTSRTQRPRRVRSASAPASARRTAALAAYPAASTVASRSVGGDRVGVGDAGLLGRVVDRGGDAVELVELALDPVGAGRAGHAGDRELDVGGRHRGRVTTPRCSRLPRRRRGRRRDRGAGCW